MGKLDVLRTIYDGGMVTRIGVNALDVEATLSAIQQLQDEGFVQGVMRYCSAPDKYLVEIRVDSLTPKGLSAIGESSQ